MTITELREKCKAAAARVPKDALVLGIIVLSSSLSFGLGYLAGQDAGKGSGEPVSLVSFKSSPVVASKNGTKYYYPDCAGAERISEENKIWFVSAAAALEAGYSAAANCTGP